MPPKRLAWLFFVFVINPLVLSANRLFSIYIFDTHPLYTPRWAEDVTEGLLAEEGLEVKSGAALIYIDSMTGKVGVLFL